MLSSRGSVYRSRKSAGDQHHYHRRCDCKIVPGFEDDVYAEVVEGYDPKGMGDRMSLIEEQTGLKFGRWKDMSALTEEMKLRDPKWLLDGTIPEVDYLFNPRSNYGELIAPNDYYPEDIADKKQEWRDLVAIDTMQSCGFKLGTRPSQIKDSGGKPIDKATSPDIWINGELWEIKSPKETKKETKPGNELKYIDNQFKEARNNFNNPYSPTTQSPEEWDGKRRVVLNLYYRNSPADYKTTIAAIKKAMKNRSIDEVIYIDESRGITKITLDE